MASHNEKQQAAVTGEKKPSRFQIEKLEERIAPKRYCGRDICYHGPGYNNGGGNGGNCGHGACK